MPSGAKLSTDDYPLHTWPLNAPHKRYLFMIRKLRKLRKINEPHVCGELESAYNELSAEYPTTRREPRS